MKLVLACALFIASAAPAMAGSHCPPGKLNVWGACVDPVGSPGHFERGRDYHQGRGYHRDHWGHRHGHGRGHHDYGYHHGHH